jgi:tetratricopeptide (TPR) repeat protein
MTIRRSRLPQVFALLFIAAMTLGGCASKQERARNYYTHGKEYLEQSDFVKARIEFRNALQLNGDMLDAWRGLAAVDEHDKNWPALAGSLQRVTELDQNDVGAREKLARLLVVGGALDRALKIITSATDIAPNDAAALALRATVQFRLKDYDGARQSALKSDQIDPGNPDAIVILAAVKFAEGDAVGALDRLSKVAKGHEDDLGVMFLKIDVYDRMGDLPKAESSLKKLIALHPENRAYQMQLVKFFLAHNRQEDALNELHKAAAADPDDAAAELALVRLLGVLQGPAAAKQELTARVSKGGNVFPYQIALAKLDFSTGDPTAASESLKRLIVDAKTQDERQTSRVTLADMDVARNDMSAANVLVAEILKDDAHNPDGLRIRAAIHLARSQVDDAINDLRAALNQQPQSSQLLASLALAYERSGAIELADKAFLDAMRSSKFDPSYGLNYVEFLRRRGLEPQSETVLQDLANRNPTSIPVLSALAKVKLGHQDWSAAHAIADAIRKLNEKSVVADLINGAAFSGQNNADNSLASLRSAFDLAPNAPEPMAALVAGYVKAHQPDKAMSFLQTVLKSNPKNAEALILTGSLEVAAKDEAKAEESFKAAISSQPKAEGGYVALANLYLHQRKLDQAVSIVNAGLEQQPKSFDLQLAAAGLMELKQQYEPAIAQYQKMLAEQPGSMVVANNLSSLLADHRSDKESLDKAASIATVLANSKVPQFEDTLGWIYYRQGDYSSAIPLLENAAKKMPGLALVRYHLGLAYLANHQEQKAIEELQSASKLASADPDLSSKIDSALKARGGKAGG